MSGIIQYLSFCEWFISLSVMSSRFIRVVAYVRISFLYKAECVHTLYLYTIFCLFIHLSRKLRLLPPLASMNNAAVRTWIYKYLFMTLLFIFWGVYSEVELLDHIIF